MVTVTSAPVIDPDRAAMSIVQEGVRLADMFPDQKAAVATWLRNEAGKLYWRAQGVMATDIARAEGWLAMRGQMLDQADRIDAELAQ